MGRMVRAEWGVLGFFHRGAPILPHLLRSSELAVVNHNNSHYGHHGFNRVGQE
jgi:hypothetical protein